MNNKPAKFGNPHASITRRQVMTEFISNNVKLVEQESEDPEELDFEH